MKRLELAVVTKAAGKRGKLPDKTRRESVPGGSVAASLLLTVLSGSFPLLPAMVACIYGGALTGIYLVCLYDPGLETIFDCWPHQRIVCNGR